METGFKHDAQQGADIAELNGFTLIQRFNERQVAAFKNGRCVDTFASRADAKEFARRNAD